MQKRGSMPVSPFAGQASVIITYATLLKPPWAKTRQQQWIFRSGGYPPWVENNNNGPQGGTTPPGKNNNKKMAERVWPPLQKITTTATRGSPSILLHREAFQRSGQVRNCFKIFHQRLQGRRTRRTQNRPIHSNTSTIRCRRKAFAQIFSIFWIRYH